MSELIADILAEVEVLAESQPQGIALGYDETTTLHASTAAYWRDVNDVRATFNVLSWDGIIKGAYHEVFADGDAALRRENLLLLAASAVAYAADIELQIAEPVEPVKPKAKAKGGE